MSDDTGREDAATVADVDPTIVEEGGAPLKRSRALAAAALDCLSEMAAILARFDATGDLAAEALADALERATVGGDNLLKGGRTDQAPRPLASLARVEDGHRLSVALLALDPAVITLCNDERSGPLDLLLAAGPDDLETSSRALRDRLATANSALSIVASRLALQARFVDAILDEEAASEAWPEPAEPLDATAARDAALAANVMLSGQPVGIASSNRQTLQSLFADMTSRTLPD